MKLLQFQVQLLRVINKLTKLEIYILGVPSKQRANFFKCGIRFVFKKTRYICFFTEKMDPKEDQKKEQEDPNDQKREEYNVRDLFSHEYGLELFE